jgi:hypothetical protein
MERSFLLPLSTEFAKDSFDSGGGGHGVVTRRRLLKRMGGATVASMVAWNVRTAKAQDETPGGALPSVTYELECIDAPLKFTDTESKPFDMGGGYFVKFKVTLKLTLASVGPSLGERGSSFSWRASSVKAEVSCTATPVDNVGAPTGPAVPVTHSGANPPSLTWSHGTHTTSCSPAGVITQSPAGPLPNKVLITSYTYGTAVISVRWELMTVVGSNKVDVRSVNYVLQNMYIDPDGHLHGVVICDPPGSAGSGSLPGGKGPGLDMRWKYKKVTVP